MKGIAIIARYFIKLVGATRLGHPLDVTRERRYRAGMASNIAPINPPTQSIAHPSDRALFVNFRKASKELLLKARDPNVKLAERVRCYQAVGEYAIKAIRAELNQARLIEDKPDSESIISALASLPVGTSASITISKKTEQLTPIPANVHSVGEAAEKALPASTNIYMQGEVSPETKRCVDCFKPLKTKNAMAKRCDECRQAKKYRDGDAQKARRENMGKVPHSLSS